MAWPLRFNVGCEGECRFWSRKGTIRKMLVAGDVAEERSNAAGRRSWALLMLVLIFPVPCDASRETSPSWSGRRAYRTLPRARAAGAPKIRAPGGFNTSEGAPGHAPREEPVLEREEGLQGHSSQDDDHRESQGCDYDCGDHVVARDRDRPSAGAWKWLHVICCHIQISWQFRVPSILSRVPSEYVRQIQYRPSISVGPRSAWSDSIEPSCVLSRADERGQRDCG